MATVDNIFNYGAVGPGYTFSPWKVSSSYDTGTVTVKNNAIVVGYAAGRYSSAAMIVNQPINFSKYRKIQIGIHPFEIVAGHTTKYLCVLTKPSDTLSASIAELGIRFSVVGQMVTGELDVSALTGWYYIGVGANGGTDEARETFAIDYIKLIP